MRSNLLSIQGILASRNRLLTPVVPGDSSGGSVGGSSGGSVGDPYTVLLQIQPFGADGSTDFEDQSFNDWTLSTIGNTNMQGNAIDFDGSGDALSVPDSDDFTFAPGHTVELFGVRFDSTSGSKNLIGQYDTAINRRSWMIRWSGGDLDLFVSTDGSADNNLIAASFTPLTDGTKYDIAIDWDETDDTVRLYIDGTMVGSAVYASTLNNAADPVYIGSRKDNAGTLSSFDGRIDAVRISIGEARYKDDGGYTVPTLPLFVPNAENTIIINNGPGYVGSILQAPSAGQWYSDGGAISGETGQFLTMTVALEGTVITHANADNYFEMWMPDDALATLVEWWDIFDDDNITLVSGDIDEWAGRVNGIIASAAGASNRPEYSATGLNGLPCAIGDGGSTRLSFDPATFPTGNTPIDFGGVGSKPDNSGNNFMDWGQQSDGRRRALSVSGSTSDIGFFGYGGGNDFKSGNGWATATRFVFVSLGFVSSFQQPINIRSDGISLGSGTVDELNSGLSFGYIMGGSDSIPGGGSWDGRGQSFIAYSGKLQDRDRIRLEGFMAHRHRIDSRLDGGHAYKNVAPIFQEPDAHRYWRIQVLTNNNASRVAIGGVILKNGATDLIDTYGGTGSASGGTASDVWNGVSNPYWTVLDTPSDQWAQWDFGAGNEQAVSAVRVIAPSSATWLDEMITGWALQWSDNGSDWTTQDNVLGVSGWNANEGRDYDMRATI